VLGKSNENRWECQENSGGVPGNQRGVSGISVGKNKNLARKN
jgi:hypothetical protein